MNRKKAILQVADTGPLESLVVMLNHAGYTCYLPSSRLQDELRALGCDTVLSVDDLVKGMGYSRPFAIPCADPDDMDTADLYVDVKGHRNGPKVWERWPNLKGKTLWYRINGGKPEHVKRPCSNPWCRGGFIADGENDRRSDKVCNRCGGSGIGEDCGDEVNPPCPVLTPNQWYSSKWLDQQTRGEIEQPLPIDTFARSYSFWPQFVRFNEYSRTDKDRLTNPICLIHGVDGWGYRDLVEPVRNMGVRVYGRGSPDGLIPHTSVKHLLHDARAYVHLKSNDAPGYALYEALASGCPVVIPRRLVWRCRMQELFEKGVTCLMFDRETHDGLTEQDVKDCTHRIGNHLHALQYPPYNRQIGEAGRERLKQIMWREDRDGPGFIEWMQRMFP